MTNFDDIRPYTDAEIPAAMQRIARSEFFNLLCAYVFPGRNIEELRAMVAGLTSIKDFQMKVMYKVNEQIITRTMTHFACKGIERLSTNKNYLFISNHRDIMLDASLLQKALTDEGFDTCEITFGANLMSSQLVIDIGKSNKMFRVERGGTMRDFYMSSRHLSDYIRHTLLTKQQSVWIAQRNGRTKDGNDRTDQGIVKMFGLSHNGNKIEALEQLNITPVSVSYEWESCDILKALELYASRQGAYIKKPGEDLNSILTGITYQKGRVNFEVCEPLTTEELAAYEPLAGSDFHKAVAALIDRRITTAYKLYPNNFIAHDLLHNSCRFSHEYTAEEHAAFVEHMKKLNEFDVPEPDILQEIFLGIYANPVDNKLR